MLRRAQRTTRWGVVVDGGDVGAESVAAVGVVDGTVVVVVGGGTTAVVAVVVAELPYWSAFADGTVAWTTMIRMSGVVAAVVGHAFPHGFPFPWRAFYCGWQSGIQMH